MGNCCGGEEEGRPLLGSNPVGARTGTLSEPTQSPVTQVPLSARQNNPIEQRGFETSIELIATVQLKDVPIQTVDKTFKDISRLYNEIVDSFRSLESDIHQFKSEFVEETNGIPVLASCVRILRQKCGDDSSVTIERKTKYFLAISYDTKTVQEHCYGDVDKLLRSLKHFKSACEHIRDILVRAPQLETNAKIILADEEKLKREIMKADIPNVPAAMKAFLENFSKMRAITAGSDTLHRDVKNKFQEFLDASKGFFPENGV